MLAISEKGRKKTKGLSFSSLVLGCLLAWLRLNAGVHAPVTQSASRAFYSQFSFVRILAEIMVWPKATL
jgi:hypothetical protein